MFKFWIQTLLSRIWKTLSQIQPVASSIWEPTVLKSPLKQAITLLVVSDLYWKCNFPLWPLLSDCWFVGLSFTISLKGAGKQTSMLQSENLFLFYRSPRIKGSLYCKRNWINYKNESSLVNVNTIEGVKRFTNLYLTYAQVAPVMTMPHIRRLHRLEIGVSIIREQN